jgi:phage tail sheath protein FI
MTYGRPGVYVSETLTTTPLQSVGATTSAGAVLGVFGQGPDTVTLVRSWFEFTDIYGGYDAKYPAVTAVSQFFKNGGTELYVQRVLSSTAAYATAHLPATDGNLATLTAKNKGSAGTSLSVQVTANSGGTWNLAVYKEVTVGGTTSSKLVENYTNLVFNDSLSSNFAETVVNNVSANIVISATNTDKTPDVSPVSLTGDNLDGGTVRATDYTALLPTDGSAELDQVNRPLVVFAAGVYDKLMADGTKTVADVVSRITSVEAAADHFDVAESIINWAKAGNGFAVVDTIAGLTATNALTFADALPATSQAAVYYPNYFVSDPTSASPQATRKVSPAAAVVGNYLRTDGAKGPFKTPAGIDARIEGAISLERAFTNKDLDDLNSSASPVNAIRNLPGAGIVIMGGRTLLQDGTANRYVNMRRSLIYIEKQLTDLTQFALFSNNDYKLWAQLRSVVTVFLNQYYNKGGLRGGSPSQAFYVKVDEQNNTASSIQNGVVNIEVGVALEYPTEFIVLNIAQITGA